jgi:hypothetical protein
MKTIEERVAKAHEKIAKWQKEIFDAQAECTHPGLTGEYGSNTGNWCSQDDCYWLDLRCPTCGKRWSVDSEEPEYRLYSMGRDPAYKCLITRK